MRNAFLISFSVHAAIAFLAASDPVPVFPRSTGTFAPVAVENWNPLSAAKKAALAHAPSEAGRPAETYAGAESSGRWESLDRVLEFGNEPPVYPMEARRRGWQGTVWLRLALKDDRIDASILQSSGHPVLDRAALQAAENWRFPGAESAWIVPVEFVLARDGGDYRTPRPADEN